MPTISIVIPSYNDGELLRHCLAALAVQTRAPDEIIVVDNNSTDDTAAVAAAAGARVVTELQRGVLRATAAGYDAARYEVIGRLDADSRPDPDWVQRIAERFDADPTLTALTGTGSFYDCNAFWRAVGPWGYLGAYFVLGWMFMGHTPVFGSNLAIRREAWLRVRHAAHITDPYAHDDLDLSFIMEPDMGVEFDRKLWVQVSGRPFDNWSGFGRRASWAFHGVAVNYREIGWWRRVRTHRAGRAVRRELQRQYGLRPATRF